MKKPTLNRTIIGLFLLLSFNCFSQKNDSIIYFPLKSSDIEMHGSVLKMLKRNHVSQDSAKSYILSTSTGKLKENFWNCTAPDNNARYKILRDSLGVLSQWNSFQIKKIEDSKGLKKVALTNDDRENNRYYGRNMNKRWLDTLRTLMKEYSANYTICLNKFEIKNNRILTHNTSFIIHLEVYDENANKIFGGKIEREHSLSKHTSYSLFPYLVRSEIDDFYSQLKEHVK